MPTIENTTGLKTWKGEYSFAVDAGAQGTKVLRSSDGTIPSGAYIFGGVLDVATSPTGVNATIAVTVNAANDIISAAAISGAPWSTTGNKSLIPVATGATTIKTTAVRAPSIVIATADLTAGIFTLILFYR